MTMTAEREQVSGRHAAVRPVVHRITTSTAAVVNEPGRHELAALLAEVERSGRGSFLIAEAGPGCYLQAVRTREGWTLQVDGRDGLRRLELAETISVEDVFVSWTSDLPGWLRMPWQPVSRDLHWLTRD